MLNNIDAMLDSLCINDIYTINPNYSEVFNGLKDKDAVSFIIEITPGEYNRKNASFCSKFCHPYCESKNDFLLIISDIIRLDSQYSQYSNISICDIYDTQSYDISKYSSLPLSEMDDIKVIFSSEFEKIRIKAYVLSIKYRILLKNMSKSSIINNEGLCFSNQKFIGIYIPLSQKLDYNLESINVFS